MTKEDLERMNIFPKWGIKWYDWQECRIKAKDFYSAKKMYQFTNDLICGTLYDTIPKTDKVEIYNNTTGKLIKTISI